MFTGYLLYIVYNCPVGFLGDTRPLQWLPVRREQVFANEEALEEALYTYLPSQASTLEA